MHWHLMRLPGLADNPSGYFIFWHREEAEEALASHEKCCYKQHQVIECVHPYCLLRLFE